MLAVRQYNICFFLCILGDSDIIKIAFSYLILWPPISNVSELVMNLKASGFSRPTNDDGFVAVNGVNMSSITCNTCVQTKTKA